MNSEVNRIEKKRREEKEKMILDGSLTKAIVFVFLVGLRP